MDEDPQATKDQDNPTDLGHRHLGVGLLAVLGGGLGAIEESVDPGENFSVRVGTGTYILDEGELVQSKPGDQTSR